MKIYKLVRSTADPIILYGGFEYNIYRPNFPHFPPVLKSYFFAFNDLEAAKVWQDSYFNTEIWRVTSTEEVIPSNNTRR